MSVAWVTVKQCHPILKYSLTPQCGRDNFGIQFCWKCCTITQCNFLAHWAYSSGHRTRIKWISYLNWPSGLSPAKIWMWRSFRGSQRAPSCILEEQNIQSLWLTLQEMVGLVYWTGPWSCFRTRFRCSQFFGWFTHTGLPNKLSECLQVCNIQCTWQSGWCGCRQASTCGQSSEFHPGHLFHATPLLGMFR